MRKFLLPRRSKKYGVILLTIGTVLGILYLSKVLPPDMLSVDYYSVFYGSFPNDLTDELIITLIISGGFITGYTREEVEDDGVNTLRLTSLVWAVGIFFSLYWLGYMQIFGFDIVQFLACLPFTIIYIYLIRFNFILYRRIKKQEKLQLQQLLK